MDTIDKSKGSKIQSVERALMLVDVLAEKNDRMSLTQLSQQLGWPKSTIHGLLSTLRDYNYISQSEDDGRYWLGSRFFELGNQVARSWDIRDAALPSMKRLNAEFGYTVHLGTEDHGEILYLEKIETDALISLMSKVGVRLPMHCSGLGKMLLAQKSKSEIKRYIAGRGLPSLTKNTITSAAKLEAELDRIKVQGYAIDDGEIMDGLRCVAAPIEDINGKVRYAISVSARTADLHGSRLDRLILEVRRAAGEISFALGNRKT